MLVILFIILIIQMTGFFYIFRNYPEPKFVYLLEYSSGMIKLRKKNSRKMINIDLLDIHAAYTCNSVLGKAVFIENEFGDSWKIIKKRKSDLDIDALYKQIVDELQTYKKEIITQREKTIEFHKAIKRGWLLIALSNFVAVIFIFAPVLYFRAPWDKVGSMVIFVLGVLFAYDLYVLLRYLVNKRKRQL